MENDLRTIIELIDILKYSKDNYPRITRKLTANQLQLIDNLADTIQIYRIGKLENIS